MTSRPSVPRVRALVLAAGRGERLRPLTLELPKPLLPVGGKPLAAWSLDRLARLGCDAAALNLHHLGAAIRDRFGDAHGRLPLVYSPERELAGTGGALPPLREFLGAAAVVLLVNGDSLCRWPLRELVAAHRRGGALATLLVHRGADPRDFGGGVAVEGERKDRVARIVAFRRGALAWEAARSHRVFAGAAALAPELLERLPEGRSDIVAALYEPMLAAGEPIAAVATSRPWFDLGTPARYLAAALAWGLAGRPRQGALVLPEAEVDATARLRRSVVERGARIGAGSRLLGTLVMPGAQVGAGARLTETIVGPHVEVPPAAEHHGVLLTRSAEGLVTTPLSARR